jgi:hypothetical protein
MSDRALTIYGTIASVLGLFTSIVTALFTQYKVVSLISLFFVEGIVVLIWLHYAKQKNRTIFPDPYEVELDYLKYVFHNENRMEYESLRVLKVTSPNLPTRHVNSIWSGRGQVSLETPLLNERPPISIDGTTGEIKFSYPLRPHHRFGDTSITFYKLTLQDDTGQNVPELYSSIKMPTKLVIMEVFLKYKQTNQPASLGIVPMGTGGVQPMVTFSRESEIPFDEQTKSYRVIIRHPTQGNMYQLKWDK